LAFEELCLGADGWVAGLVCAFPKETMAIYNLIQQKEYDKALAIYRWFMPLLELDIHPKLVQYIKLAEAQNGIGKLAEAQNGIGSENVRPPRLPLVGEERESVLNIIKTGIKNRPKL